MSDVEVQLNKADHRCLECQAPVTSTTISGVNKPCGHSAGTLVVPKPEAGDQVDVDEVRRKLMQASIMWQQRADERAVVIQKGSDATDDEKITFLAALMAANYSYTLAAVLGIAKGHVAVDVAARLAFAAHDIMENGDHEGFNADVMPAEEAAPEAEQ